ncbi:hypothetical protein Q6316_29930, partial [Klebsiella pneumoniae]|uniref:hypothetical protein n=1 Tax=Klebsiella pneumoniae TaxID=573 RepID=UPI0027302FC9
NGQMTGLGTLGGSFSTGWAINDAVQIAGDSWTPNPGGAFLYSKGVMNYLGTLGGTLSAAFGINAAGLVVGDSYTKNSY